MATAVKTPSSRPRTTNLSPSARREARWRSRERLHVLLTDLAKYQELDLRPLGLENYCGEVDKELSRPVVFGDLTVELNADQPLEPQLVAWLRRVAEEAEEAAIAVETRAKFFARREITVEVKHNGKVVATREHLEPCEAKAYADTCAKLPGFEAKVVPATTRRAAK